MPYIPRARDITITNSLAKINTDKIVLLFLHGQKDD